MKKPTKKDIGRISVIIITFSMLIIGLYSLSWELKRWSDIDTEDNDFYLLNNDKLLENRRISYWNGQLSIGGIIIGLYGIKIIIKWDWWDRIKNHYSDDEREFECSECGYKWISDQPGPCPRESAHGSEN